MSSSTTTTLIRGVETFLIVLVSTFLVSLTSTGHAVDPTTAGGQQDILIAFVAAVGVALRQAFATRDTSTSPTPPPAK
jgi:hypothetical protein